MLSRVAEALYWMARYIERAEDLTRLLLVNFNALLDSQPAAAREAWQSMLQANGDEAHFAELYGEPDTQAVLRYMFRDPQNPNSIAECIIQARENARGVREQISSEMWEALNRLYFTIQDAKWQTLLTNPTTFSLELRDRAQALQGIAGATMSHGEPYRFIQLGLHLERADKTTRILGAKHAYLSRFREGSPEISLQLIALLRSCSAFEPYSRALAGQLNTARVIQYLLLDREFPRAVTFCLRQCLRALETIGEAPHSLTGGDAPRRTLGRLSAELEYLDIQTVLGENLGPFLLHLLDQLNNGGDEIARAYFNTSVILPDERPRQQQQQQQ